MKEILFEEKIYKVSFEAMPESLKERLPGKKLEYYLHLLEKVQFQPKVVYKEIKTFSAEHPDVPEVINLLTFAHIKNRRIGEAEYLIEKTFQDYPNYLFARINYADQCVRQKKLDKVSEIFPSFDLKELYPEKEIFHASEFRGFLIMMAHYYRAQKMKEKALPYFDTLKKMDPYHPGVLYLEKKLVKRSLFHRLFGLKK